MTLHCHAPRRKDSGCGGKPQLPPLVLLCLELLLPLVDCSLGLRDRAMVDHFRQRLAEVGGDYTAHLECLHAPPPCPAPCRRVSHWTM